METRHRERNQGSVFKPCVTYLLNLKGQTVQITFHFALELSYFGFGRNIYTSFILRSTKRNYNNLIKFWKAEQLDVIVMKLSLR